MSKKLKGTINELRKVIDCEAARLSAYASEGKLSQDYIKQLEQITKCYTSLARDERESKAEGSMSEEETLYAIVNYIQSLNHEDRQRIMELLND